MLEVSKKNTLVCLTCLLLCLVLAGEAAIAAPLSWATKASMPTPRSMAASAATSDRIFVLGGKANSEASAVVEMYDPATDTWQTNTPLPEARFAGAEAFQGTTVYIAGGSVSGGTLTSTIISYDTANGSSAIIGNLCNGRIRASAAILGNKLYVVGGSNSSGQLHNTLEEFDLATHVSVVKATLPAARELAGISVSQGKLYILGGVDSSGTAMDNTWEYDPADNVFTVKSSIPVPVGAKALTSSTGKIYLIGGITNSNTMSWTTEIQKYDPVSNTWQRAGTIPTTRYAPAAQIIDGFLQVIGGDNGQTAASPLGVNEACFLGNLQVSGGVAHTVALKNDGTVWALGQNYYGQLGDGTSTDRYSSIQVTGLTGLTGATAIAAGNNYTIALKNDGTVWAWGNNYSGQLGDGSTRLRNSPNKVPGLAGITAIAATHSSHTIALRNDGTVWAWGTNSSGQLGDGTTTSRTTPQQVPGLTGVIAIAGGYQCTLALKNDGTVWAWGKNDYGQLGDGTTTSRTAPIQVAGLTGVTAMASGYLFSVALKNDGTVWAWGGNYSGQLADGTTTNRYTPEQIAGLSGVTAIAAGNAHAIALKSDGSIWAWGENDWGQLGDGSRTDRTIPIQVPGLTGVSAIAAAPQHTIAMKNDGTIWAWGLNNCGQLGNGTRDSNTTHTTPSQVIGFIPDTTPPVTTLSSPEGVYTAPLSIILTANEPAAIYYTLDGNDPKTASAVYSGPIPITTSTTLKFFARDLALNTETVRSVVYTIADTTPPVTTASLPGGTYTTPPTVTLTVNEPATIYYTVDGSEPTTSSPVYGPIHITRSTTLRFFARDIAGNMENIKTETYTIMASPLGLSTVAGGGVHAAALRNNGTVWAWGSNWYGQLGDGTNTQRTTPVQVPGLTGITAIATGGRHTVALKNDGTVWAWGGGGQLGDGTTTDRNTPAQVPGLTGVAAIAAGEMHTVALKNDGTVWAWGRNSYGQLGDGTNGDPLDHATPIQVVGLNNIINISAGYGHSVALKHDGTVWAWGQNWYGQLGDGTSTPNQYSTSPVMVPGMTGVTAIAAGVWHTVALKNDGTVWAWGLNSSGELGDGTTTDRTTPVQATGLSDVTAIAASRHTIALKKDGTVWTWGLNDYGALGLGDEGASTSRTTPTQVPNQTGFVAIAAGSSLTVALKEDSTIWAWGYNGAGQLGNGTISDYRAVPGKVFGFSPIDTTTPVTTASLPTGTYTSSQAVTLTVNKPATIYYTVNGVAPTTASPVYTGPIILSSSTTLKFFAKDIAGNVEPLKSKSYAITTPTGNADACQQLTLAKIKLSDNGSDSYFARLTDAYAAASASNNVLVTLPSGQLSETLMFDKGINLVIRGGYDANYGTLICRSTIQGSMVVGSGSVTVEGTVEIR